MSEIQNTIERTYWKIIVYSAGNIEIIHKETGVICGFTDSRGEWFECFPFAYDLREHYPEHELIEFFEIVYKPGTKYKQETDAR